MRPPPFVAATSAALALVAAIAGLFAGIAQSAEGPSSRRTHWSISEIMFHPSSREDGRDLEFIEILNAGWIAEDLGGHRLVGEIEFTFPAETLVPAGARVVVAKAPADLIAAHALEGVLGPYTGRLANEGGSVRLVNPAGAILLEAEYRPGIPWPAGADGAGLSLVLRHPSFGERDPRAWSGSARTGGSPGTEDPVPLPAAFQVDEINAMPFVNAGTYVELVNLTDATQELGGLQFVAPAQNYRRTLSPLHTLPPKGRITILLEVKDDRRLAGIGESLLVLAPNGIDCLASLRFGPTANGIAFNRDASAPSGWIPAQEPTPGFANSPPRAFPIVFSEIMYHPPDPGERGEYVELHNRSSERMNLAGWRLADAVEYTFPDGTSLAPGGHLVVARNPAFLRTLHPELPATLVLGPFQGNLSNRRKRLALESPRTQFLPLRDGRAAWLSFFVQEAEISYSSGGEWGPWSDGGGSSLERRDVRSPGFSGTEWTDSDESAASEWTSFEVTGRAELGLGDADQLQLFALGAGEYLVDDLRVTAGGGANRLAQGTFDAGVSGWVFRGTHGESRWDAEAGALRLIARGRGDTGANRTESLLSTPIPAGSTVTVAGRARWLRGDPHLLLRLRGNSFEAPLTLRRPPALGSPGRARPAIPAGVGPAIAGIHHHPILPRANEPCVVTARISDPDGIASVLLRWRLDPSRVETVQGMNDDGVAGDALANDGIYSTTLPGGAAGTLYAFRIEATDASGSAHRRTFPDSEALIRVGEVTPAPALGTYRLWMTQTSRQRWASRARLDNTPLPVTFVYNNERAIHGVGALYAGSPHISPGYSGPTGSLCGYVLHFPNQEPFLGATDVVLDWPGRDATAQQEPMAYWIARELGIPFNHRRYIHLHVNGVTDASRGSIYEDAQQVNNDLVESWVPDAAEGDLYKIEQWFEFDDRLNLTAIVAPRLEAYHGAGGQLVDRRYRWNWLKRATDAPHDYAALRDLVTVANASRAQGYPTGLAATADLEEWMRVFAVENIVVNLDAWGYDIGKNMYAHHAPGSRWRLFMWDIDWVMLASAQHGYTPRSPLMYHGSAPFGDGNRDPVVGRMYAEPVIQRAYWRAIRDAVDGPLQPDRVRQRLVDTHAALVRAGVTMSSAQSLADPEPVRAWLQARREFLIEQLATVAAAFQVDPLPESQSSPAELMLSGNAPIEAATITVNGAILPVTWSKVTRWSLLAPLQPGTNLLEVAAVDARGMPVPGSPHRHRILYDGTAPEPAGTVIVNEWMAANATAVADPADGHFEDWLELFNPTGSTLDLSGWWLTDDDALPDQYVFPRGTTLGAQGYLVLWADGEPSQSATAGRHHLPFRLDRAGETLTLRSPGSGTVVRVELGTATTDRARGQFPNGAHGSAVDLAQPTPGSGNSDPFAQEPPLQIRQVSRVESGGLRITWTSVPGRRYRLEATSRVGGAFVTWQGTGQEVTASGTETTAALHFSPPDTSAVFLRVALAF